MNQATAKIKAIAALDKTWVNPASIVSYKSKGLILLVGDNIEQVNMFSQDLNDSFEIYCLLQNGVKPQKPSVKTWFGVLAKVDGYLGNFSIDALCQQETISLKADAQSDKLGKFDVVAVLSNTRDSFVFNHKSPFGFYDLSNTKNMQAFLPEINMLQGVLDKPKYFNYESDLCVHSRNKTEACRRCIEVCPAKAIVSDGDKVRINPYLCQGFGSCASVCPSGAIRFAYPTLSDTIKQLANLLGAYKAAGGENPRILFYPEDELADRQALDLTDLDDSVLPFALEEIGMIDLSILLIAYSLGATGVMIYCVNEARQTEDTLKRQLKLCEQILSHTDFLQNTPFARLVTESTIVIDNDLNTIKIPIIPANHHNKRDYVFDAVDFLTGETVLSPLDFDVKDDAPFGEVVIDKTTCTLCMACISVCPPNALSSGDTNVPIIYFKESACVQCGLCQKSCPEDAIVLNQRMNFYKSDREKKHILNQDEPFKCIDCGKVFGSSMVVLKMMDKLKNHSMFTDGQLENLKKCEDCRVKAMFKQLD